MQFERQVTQVGGSLGIVIPPDLLKYLNLSAKDIMVIQDEKGKHGKFFSVWKKGDVIDDNSETTKKL